MKLIARSLKLGKKIGLNDFKMMVRSNPFDAEEAMGSTSHPNLEEMNQTSRFGMTQLVWHLYANMTLTCSHDALITFLSSS